MLLVSKFNLSLVFCQFLFHLYASAGNTSLRFRISSGMRPDDTSEVKIWRHVVSLRLGKHIKFFGDNHFCAGSILASQLVITAAHCVTYGKSLDTISRESIMVAAGTSQRLNRSAATRVGVSNVMVHPDYNRNNYNSDIALIRLNRPLNEDGRRIAIVALPTGPPCVDQQCTVMGWGEIISHGPIPNELLYVEINIWNIDECRRRNPKFFADGMLCAGSKAYGEWTACRGDSGGPLICNDTLVGVLSHGKICGSSHPDYYTDVFYFKNWIENSSGNISLRKISLFLIIIVLMITLQT